MSVIPKVSTILLNVNPLSKRELAPIRNEAVLLSFDFYFLEMLTPLF
jgi:hypothetical protein